MRKNVISLSFVVLALVLGACAGRQMHAGMPGTSSFQASVRQEAPRVSKAADPAVVPTPAVQDDAAASAAQLSDDELRLKVQQEIDAYANDVIERTNASNRAAAEKSRRTDASPSSDDAALIAALHIDDGIFRRLEAEADRAFYAAIGDIFRRVDALEREKRERLAAVRDGHRRASAAPQIASSVPVEPTEPETVLAASAAPGSGPSTMPKDAASAASAPMKTTQDPSPSAGAPFIPDVSAVAQARETASVYLTGTLIAAVLGLLLALAIVRRRSREFRSLMRDEFKGVPDGALFVQEIHGGAVRRTFMVLAKARLREIPLDPDAVEALERQWFDQSSSDAAAAANDEVSSEPPEREPPTANDRPVPVSEPRIDPFEPPPAPAPAPVPLPGLPPVRPARLASGSGQISSQGREMHSVGGEIDATPKDDVHPDVDTHKIIVFEDRSAPSN